jgi:hypothetical protein
MADQERYALTAQDLTRVRTALTNDRTECMAGINRARVLLANESNPRRRRELEAAQRMNETEQALLDQLWQRFWGTESVVITYPHDA